MQSLALQKGACCIDHCAMGISEAIHRMLASKQHARFHHVPYGQGGATQRARKVRHTIGPILFADLALPPACLMQSWHVQVDIVSRHNSSQFHQKCHTWIDEPTLLYSGMPVDHENVFHFFTDNILRVFTTLADQGLIDVAAATAR